VDNDRHELLTRVRRIERKLDELIALLQSLPPETTNNDTAKADKPILPVDKARNRVASPHNEVGA
jgi:hypothetical protein